MATRRRRARSGCRSRILCRLRSSRNSSKRESPSWVHRDVRKSPHQTAARENVRGAYGRSCWRCRLLVLVSLVAGMAGYEHYERLPWRDAFLNTAMLLGGMGPVDAPHSNGGKLFAGIFALYSGVVFLVVSGLFLAPVIHRIMHRFHWEAPRS